MVTSSAPSILSFDSNLLRLVPGNPPQSLVDIFARLSDTCGLVRWFGDPVLRAVAETVTMEDFQDGNVSLIARELLGALGKVRKDLGIGRAIAAPQIGVSKKMILVVGCFDDPAEASFFVNPRTIWRSSQQNLFCEMCLSALPLAADVVRPSLIEIQYQDLQGKFCSMKPTAILSRVLQHEMDHLEGILFLDRADPKSIRFVSDFDNYRKTTKLIDVD